MSFTMNLYYTGEGDNAKKFAQEMDERGIADQIRQQPGNLKYEYFQPLDDPHTILLIDTWESQEALDADHDSPMMAELAKLREKYNLHMRAERFIPEKLPDRDNKFLRK